MNSLAPRYGFNLGGDRFDTQVMTAYQQGKMLRHDRDALIAQVHGGRWSHLLPNRLDGLADMPEEACARAAVNIIDYYFEPHVLPGMKDEQAHEYFCGFAKTMRVEAIEGIRGGEPLWVETAHHVCVFSILYDLILHLARHHGVRRAILLHQGQRPEPRLGLIGRLLRTMHRIDPHFIQLNGNWFATLSRTVTPDTVIFYLSDVPPMTDGGHGAAKHRDPAQVRLLAPPATSVTVETTPGAAILARRLKANHVVLEYPGVDRIRVRPFNPDVIAPTVPLEDWVFWPLLKVA